MTQEINIATFILDDDIDVLDIIKATIDRAGIRNYKLFTNEEKFISGLTEDIHVCVVDHWLSRRTGLDILKEIKNKNEASFVIAYTVGTNPDIIIDYLNGGADRFVDKNKANHLDMLTSYLKEGLEIGTRRIEYSSFLKAKKEKMSHEQSTV